MQKGFFGAEKVRRARNISTRDTNTHDTAHDSVAAQCSHDTMRLGPCLQAKPSGAAAAKPKQPKPKPSKPSKKEAAKGPDVFSVFGSPASDNADRAPAASTAAAKNASSGTAAKKKAYSLGTPAPL